MTRLYFQNDTIPYDPATERGAWNAGTAGYTGIKLGTTKAGAAASIARTEANATNNWDVLSLKAVTDALEVDLTIEGTVEWIIGALESAAGANDFTHVHIFVTQGDSDLVRGTLLTDHIGSTELPLTNAEGVGSGAVAITSVAALAGDRIVVELGWQAQNTSTTSFETTYHYGNTGATDLTLGSTNVTTEPGWIEFSTNLSGVTPQNSMVAGVFGL